MCDQGLSQGLGRNVVDERPTAVDLNDREELAVAPLQVSVSADVHLFQREAELASERRDRRPSPLAQVTALGVVKDDPRQKRHLASDSGTEDSAVPRRNGSK